MNDQPVDRQLCDKWAAELALAREDARAGRTRDAFEFLAELRAEDKETRARPVREKQR